MTPPPRPNQQRNAFLSTTMVCPPLLTPTDNCSIPRNESTPHLLECEWVGTCCPKKLDLETGVTARLSGLDQRALAGAQADGPPHHQLKEGPFRCSHTYLEPTTGEHGPRVVYALLSMLLYLCRHGSLVHGQALWVGLDIEGSKLRILNVYTHVDMQRRAAFWRIIVDTLPEIVS